MDDWGGAHFRLWPLALWEWVSELLEEVEVRGRWPEELRGGMVSMLPKGNTGEPLDHRPVVLLPVLYRMWARVRARELDRWMQTSGRGALPGRSKGAEEHGPRFALGLEYARAKGEGGGGLARGAGPRVDGVRGGGRTCVRGARPATTVLAQGTACQAALEPPGAAGAALEPLCAAQGPQ